ncbi:hypothetical protein [Arthrobacter sp. Cr_A7]|uniref:hypothetical protein n=1 Tax=Arthrobacter sp. Cr_A7 TaxID=3031017 RepID=UPI0023DA7FC1|nr:hypothetical protein [Arthrobacter sp. Cr_A7]MDF2049974.1 hypothetical protein [Arthrobacter sp. Cr_A7]
MGRCGFSTRSLRLLGISANDFQRHFELGEYYGYFFDSFGRIRDDAEMERRVGPADDDDRVFGGTTFAAMIR